MSRTDALSRSWDDRILGGVCGGLGTRFEIGAWWIRLAFVLLAVVDGLGLLLYAAMWLLMPQAGSNRRKLSDVLWRNARAFPQELAHSLERLTLAARGADAQRLLAIGLVGAGGVVLSWSVGTLDWMSGARLVALIAIAGGVALLNKSF